MSAAIYIAVMALIAAVSTFLVLYHGYRETLTQCLSLGVMAVAAVAEIRVTLRGIDSQTGFDLLMAGIALFAISTLFKRRQRRREVQETTQ